MKRMSFDGYKKEQLGRYHNFAPNERMETSFRKTLDDLRDVEESRKQLEKGSKYKVVVSAHVVEVYEYEIPVNTGERPPPKKNYDEETGEIIPKGSYDPEEAKKHNSRRSKNELRRLITANFDNDSKFVTLTFRDGAVSDVTDVRECNKAFELFIKRMRKRYKDFKYVKVIEFQDSNDRGAVHYHLVMTIPFIHYDKLAELWGNGYIGINRIDHVDNVGAYIRKYMVKDFSDPRLFGEKAYSCSKNLIRPIVLYGHEAVEIIDKYLKGKKEVFASSYESEYQGEIVYKEFNLQRNNNSKEPTLKG